MPFTQQGLSQTQLDGFNCWEIALELGQFTFKYLHSDLYEQKFTLFGGKELNGFESWRNLEKNYGGSGKTVEVSGLSRFVAFPQCETDSGLFLHLARWEEYLNKYGSELRRTPDTLRVMVLNTLPRALADKLRPKRAKYPTFQSILQYVRDRLEEQREIAKADAIHQTKKPAAKITSLAASTARGAAATATLANVRPSATANQAPTMEDLQSMVVAMGPRPQTARKFTNHLKQQLFVDAGNAASRDTAATRVKSGRRSLAPMAGRPLAIKEPRTRPG